MARSVTATRLRDSKSTSLLIEHAYITHMMMGWLVSKCILHNILLSASQSRSPNKAGATQKIQGIGASKNNGTWPKFKRAGQGGRPTQGGRHSGLAGPVVMRGDKAIDETIGRTTRGQVQGQIPPGGGGAG